MNKFRRIAIEVNENSSLLEQLIALGYCIIRPRDIPAVFINLHYAEKRSFVPLKKIFFSLSQRHGLIGGYNTDIDKMMDDSQVIVNPFFNDGQANAVTIFIGVNQSGSWSLREAFEKIFVKESIYSVEDYTYEANSQTIPTLSDEIKQIGDEIKSFESEIKFIYSHRGIPLHLSLRSDYFSAIPAIYLKF